MSPFGGDLNPVGAFGLRSSRFVAQIVVSERKKAIGSYMIILNRAIEFINARKDNCTGQEDRDSFCHLLPFVVSGTAKTCKMTSAFFAL